MNERIRELIEQCTSLSEGSTWTSREEFDKEKFAELIVRECVSVINTGTSEHEDDDECVRAWKLATEFAVYQIKRHFGVTE